MKSRLGQIGLVVCSAGILMIFPGLPPVASQEAEAEVITYQADKPLPQDVEAGDVLLDAQGVELEVPAPGTGVSVEIITETGSLALSVQTDPDGTVHVADWGPEAVHDGGGGGGGTAPPCIDDAYTLSTERESGTEFVKWYGSMLWYLKSSSVPSELTVSEAQDEVEEATYNITEARSGCDSFTDTIAAYHAYGGSTTRSVQMSPPTDLGVSCNANGNGFSDFSFAAIDDDPATPADEDDFLAVACTWDQEHSGIDQITESDIRTDTSGRDWVTTPIPTGCQTKWSLEAVTTHERGHSYGLGHVGEATSGNLTMSTGINGSCQNGESSLGYGDYLGLEQLY